MDRLTFSSFFVAAEKEKREEKRPKEKMAAACWIPGSARIELVFRTEQHATAVGRIA